MVRRRRRFARRTRNKGSTYRKKRFTKRSVKRSILSNVVKRKIELSLPVYMIRSATAHVNGLVANYSLNTTAIQGSLDLGVDFTLAASSTRSYAPEIIRLAKTFSHYKMSGVSMKYNRSIADANVSVLNYGPFNAFPLLRTTTITDSIALANNYTFDNSLRIAPNAASTKTKYWKFPDMSIFPGSGGGTGIPTNAWIPCNTNVELYVNIGQPSTNQTGTGTGLGHNIMDADVDATTVLVGTITMTMYLHFGIPRVEA